MAFARFAPAAFLFSSLLLLFAPSSHARDFLVGGSAAAWKVPSSTLDSLNRWAQSNRFRPGDILVWKYDASKDSVLRVTRDHYLSCNSTDPMAQGGKDGEFKVVLHKPGPYYFISGAAGACEKGEKVIVVVMSPRGARLGAPASAPAPAPAPGSAAAEGPAGALGPVAGKATRSGAAVGMGGALAGALMVTALML